MITVILNLVQLDPVRNGGVSRIAHEVAHLLLDFSGVQTICIVGAGFADHFKQWLGREVAFIPYPQGTEPGPLLRALKADFIVSPLFGNEPFQGEAFSDSVHIIALPDALALDKPQLFLPQELAQRKTIYESAISARTIVVPSEYSKHRLTEQLRIASERFFVVPHGAEPLAISEELPRQSLQEQPRVLQPYIFYPANNWPHKRHELLFAVMQHVWKARPEINLVLTGGRSGSVDIEALSAKAPVGRIHDLGFVSENHLRTLYQNAEAMVFVSEYEGFGMPIVEAMLNNCPVICSPLTAIREIAGDAALFVPSDEPQDWANALINILPVNRAELILKGKKRAAQFTWDRMRVGWTEALQDAGLKPNFNNTAQLLLPLDVVAKELEMWRKQTNTIDISVRQKMSQLEQAIQSVDATRLTENHNRFAKLPVIGFFIRTLLRIRNLGHMWEANAKLNWILFNQLASIETRLQTKPDDEKRGE